MTFNHLNSDYESLTFNHLNNDYESYLTFNHLNNDYESYRIFSKPSAVNGFGLPLPTTV